MISLQCIGGGFEKSKKGKKEHCMNWKLLTDMVLYLAWPIIGSLMMMIVMIIVIVMMMKKKGEKKDTELKAIDWDGFVTSVAQCQ